MRVLAVSGSPNKGGNTATLLGIALDSAKAEGAETELFSVSGKNIQPCDGCWGCRQSGTCHIKDDMQELYEKLIAADGIIFGTPIYFWGITSQAKAIMDRTIALNRPDRNLNNKVAGVVATCGSLGLVEALMHYSYYFIQRRMLPANQVSTYVRRPDDLKGMEQCIQATRDLGRQMVALINLGFRYPAEFIKGPGAFGTHTR